MGWVERAAPGEDTRVDRVNYDCTNHGVRPDGRGVSQHDPNRIFRGVVALTGECLFFV